MFDTKTLVAIFEVPLPGRQNKYCINSDCSIIIIMSYKVYNNFANYMVGLQEVCLFLVRRMDVMALGILEPFVIKQGYWKFEAL